MSVSFYYMIMKTTLYCYHCRYGYRGNDCRSNVFVLVTDEIVYFLSNIAVLYNKQTHRQRHYREHTEDINWYYHKNHYIFPFSLKKIHYIYSMFWILNVWKVTEIRYLAVETGESKRRLSKECMQLIVQWMESFSCT